MMVEASGSVESISEEPVWQTTSPMPHPARARATAAGLLGENSGNYNLYAALGWILGLTGQHKVTQQLPSFLAESLGVVMHIPSPVQDPCPIVRLSDGPCCSTEPIYSVSRNRCQEPQGQHHERWRPLPDSPIGGACCRLQCCFW